MQVFSLLNVKKGEKSQEEYLDDLVSHVEDTPVGFAGFIEKRYLHESLKWLVFGSGNNIQDENENGFSKEGISKEVKKTLKKCEEEIQPQDETFLWLFPTLDSFVSSEMNGVSGFTPYRNAILILVSSQGFDGNALTQTVAHEYIHSVRFEYFEELTLLESFITEGLAEHFSEFITGKESKFSKRVDKNTASKVLSELKSQFDSTDIRLQREVMVYGEKYSRWTGYAIGYEIIGSYMKNNPDITWREIIKVPPKQIYNDS